jgi:hypothetical protein
MPDMVCRYAGLLRFALAPTGAGKGLFFSYEADVSLTQQGHEKLAADATLKNASLADRADQRFFFNRQLTRHLAGLPSLLTPAVPIRRVAYTVSGHPRQPEADPRFNIERRLDDFIAIEHFRISKKKAASGSPSCGIFP